MPLGDLWHRLKKICSTTRHRWGSPARNWAAEAATAFVQCGANGPPTIPCKRPPLSPAQLPIEPHPHYCDILRKRYSNSPNVEVIECAADQLVQKRTLYFAPPDLADQMDGSGPRNNWARGQAARGLSPAV
jgi:hypothetical protein